MPWSEQVMQSDRCEVSLCAVCAWMSTSHIKRNRRGGGTWLWWLQKTLRNTSSAHRLVPRSMRCRAATHPASWDSEAKGKERVSTANFIQILFLTSVSTALIQPLRTLEWHDIWKSIPMSCIRNILTTPHVVWISCIQKYSNFQAYKYRTFEMCTTRSS